MEINILAVEFYNLGNKNSELNEIIEKIKDENNVLLKKQKSLIAETKTLKK